MDNSEPDRPENTNDNPKSWIAWKRKAEALERERDEAKRALLAGPDKILRCAFCGHEYPDGTPATKHEALRRHVRRCKAHPLYIEFMDYLRAECEAWGVDATLPDDAENPPLHLAARVALKQKEMKDRLAEAERLLRSVRYKLSAFDPTFLAIDALLSANSATPREAGSPFGPERLTAEGEASA